MAASEAAVPQAKEREKAPILIHYIDGCIIEECADPFVVSCSKSLPVCWWTVSELSVTSFSLLFVLMIRFQDTFQVPEFVTKKAVEDRLEAYAVAGTRLRQFPLAMTQAALA